MIIDMFELGQRKNEQITSELKDTCLFTPHSRLKNVDLKNKNEKRLNTSLFSKYITMINTVAFGINGH